MQLCALEDYRRRYPERQVAMRLVNRAIARGDLVRKPCERCGKTQSGPSRPVDAHHDDYSKPLEVRWFCRSCHRRYHDELDGGVRLYRRAT